jgi:hypothetical protein
MTFRMRKRSLRAHGLEDTDDVKVRVKVVAGTALVTLKRNIFRVFGGLQEKKRQIE